MYGGFCQAAKKSGHNNEVAVLTRWPKGGVPLYLNAEFSLLSFSVDIFESSPAREPEISLLAAQLSHKGVKTYKVCKGNRTLVKRRTLRLRPTRISE